MSGSHQAVVRQSSNCYESVIFCAAVWTESLLSLFLAKICRLFENCVKKKKCVSCTRWYNTSPLYPHQQCENFMIFISNWKINGNFKKLMFYFIKVFELNIKPNYSGKRNWKNGSLMSIPGPKRSCLFVDLTMVTVKWCYLIFFSDRDCKIQNWVE